MISYFPGPGTLFACRSKRRCAYVKDTTRTEAHALLTSTQPSPFKVHLGDALYGDMWCRRGAVPTIMTTITTTAVPYGHYARLQRKYYGTVDNPLDMTASHIGLRRGLILQQRPQGLYLGILPPKHFD